MSDKNSTTNLTRYKVDSWKSFFGDLIRCSPSPDGEWVRFEEANKIANELQKLKSEIEISKRISFVRINN